MTTAAEKIGRRAPQVPVMKGIILLVLVGVCFGLVPALSRMAMLDEANAIGLTAWVLVISAALSGGVAILSGRVPRLKLHEVQPMVLLAIVGTVLPELAMFWVAEHVQASVIAIIVALESLFVFVIAAVMRLEPPCLRRFAGLCLGLTCIVLMMLPGLGAAGGGGWLWILAALVVPMFYAGEDVMISSLLPERLGAIETVAILSTLAAMIAVPLALSTGSTIAPRDLMSGPGWAVIGISALNVLGMYLIVYTVRATGAVFASQCGYTITIAGIFWGILLLNEQLNIGVWGAVLCILAGLVLVRPGQDDVGAEPAQAVAA